MADYISDTDQLLVLREDKLVILTLNRVSARNALSTELTNSLRRAIAWVADDPSVTALVITGAGTAFCSGGDVKAMGERSPAAKPASLASQFEEMRARHHELSGALHRLRIPTIAALPGPAAGAGMALALACDLRIAADTAFLSTGYARIGLPGDYGIAWLLTRVVGPGRARELMLTGERVAATRALQIGLVNQVFTPEELMPETRRLALGLANGPRVAYRYIKDNLDDALVVDHASAIDREADRLLKARSTADHREAVKAFAEKREPRFVGE